MVSVGVNFLIADQIVDCGYLIFAVSVFGIIVAIIIVSIILILPIGFENVIDVFELTQLLEIFDFSFLDGCELSRADCFTLLAQGFEKAWVMFNARKLGQHILGLTAGPARF